MNLGLLDMLSAGALADVKADMAALLTDPQIGAVACTFRARGAHGYQPAAGTVSSTDTLTTILATITPLTEREIADGERRGDVRILIATSQLTVAPRPDDVVSATVSGKNYHVLSSESYGMATHYALVGRES